MLSEVLIKIHSRLFEIPYTPGLAGAFVRIEDGVNARANGLANGMFWISSRPKAGTHGIRAGNLAGRVQDNLTHNNYSTWRAARGGEVLRISHSIGLYGVALLAVLGIGVRALALRN